MGVSSEVHVKANNKRRVVLSSNYVGLYNVFIYFIYIFYLLV